MMKTMYPFRIFALWILVLVALTSCSVKQKVQETPVLTVSEFVLRAEQLENTVVNVVGRVDHLCMGSKAKIHFVCPEHPEESVKIFADEKMGVFSDTLRDKVIRVTGVVKVSTKIDEAYLDEWEAELAEDENAHLDDEDEAHAEHPEGEEPETHHHGNQMALIAKYRKQIELSGKGFINLYKLIVSEVSPAEIPAK
jgi:hypothetical protein